MKYERHLARCEDGWRATGDPGFIREAQIWTHLYRQPPLLWLSEAVIELATKRRTKGYATRVFRNAVKQMRFEAVRAAVQKVMPRATQKAKPKAPTWDEAYEIAAAQLAGTRAAGKAGTMKAAYVEVNRDRKTGRGGLYLEPLEPRKKLGEALKREPSPR